MTTLRVSHQERRITYSLSGHADYNPGNDVVCAAISTIIYGFANYLDNAQLEGKIEDLIFEDVPGDMTLQFTIKDFNEFIEIETLVMTYFMMISEQFPNNLFIED